MSLIKNFILDIIFPPVCLNCGKEENYLCDDCQSLIEISQYQFCPGCGKITLDGRTCGKCRREIKLTGLYSAADYQNKLMKKTISQFKYEPFVRKLAAPLCSLIIAHFKLLNKQPAFLNKENKSEFILIPVPLSKKRLRWRGFNQAEEIAKELSTNLEIPDMNRILLRTKETAPQINLAREEREKNIKGAFSADNKEISLRNKKILLVDDVYTTGSTMNECARVLKSAGTKQIWGITLAREK